MTDTNYFYRDSTDKENEAEPKELLKKDDHADFVLKDNMNSPVHEPPRKSHSSSGESFFDEEKKKIRELFKNSELDNPFFDGLIKKGEPSVHVEEERGVDEISYKSVDNVGTESTSSSLKNMIDKTEKLKGKFNELESQLKRIKGGNSSTPEKIHDQIQAYSNYYYSDFLDVSNDSDFI
jgi:hypothetical protein